MDGYNQYVAHGAYSMMAQRPQSGASGPPPQRGMIGMQHMRGYPQTNQPTTQQNDNAIQNSMGMGTRHRANFHQQPHLGMIHSMGSDNPQILSQSAPVLSQQQAQQQSQQQHNMGNQQYTPSGDILAILSGAANRSSTNPNLSSSNPINFSQDNNGMGIGMGMGMGMGMSNMGIGMGMNGRNTVVNLQNAGQMENQNNPSNAFDLNEFPALSHDQPNYQSSSNAAAGSSMQEKLQEYRLQKEDFPALGSGGAQQIDPRKDVNSINEEERRRVNNPEDNAMFGSAQRVLSHGHQQQHFNMQQLSQVQKLGNSGTPGLGSGNVASSNASNSIDPQQQQSQQNASNSSSSQFGANSRFGLLGLLGVIRMTDPDLNTLALGTDLTTLGLNLNSPDLLYSTFTSPFADQPSTKDPDFYLPLCYYVHPPSHPASMKMSLFSEETLCYIFYSMPRDTLQVAASLELYNRGWRYHKEMQKWFMPVGSEKGSGGSVLCFEPTLWDRVRKDGMQLYEGLEDISEIPTLPSNP